MFKRMIISSFVVIFVTIGCASTSSFKRTESVTIILTNGDKIKADVLDIHQGKVIFKAKNWKKAYEYGEVINVERIKEIKIADGKRLSVKEFDAYRQGAEIISSKEEPNQRKSLVAEKVSESGKDAESQYEELKKKPISEMTDNEFRFFMMMKDRELRAQEEAAEIDKIEKSAEVDETNINEKASEKIAVKELKIPPVEKVASESAASVPVRTQFPAIPSGSIQIEEVVNSLVEAEIATSYLTYLNKKNSRGKPLSSTELNLKKLIENSPNWQEKLEDMQYLNRTAEKTLSRAYLYNPDDLNEKLGLNFDQDLDMDYFDLMAQLHRKIGEDVKMGDFRILVDVFDESGARAIKEILENYATWQFILSKNNNIATK